MKPMLARDADPEKLKFPLYAQVKLDGIRCVIVDGKPLSRTLKEIPNREIFEALSDPALEGLDGEIIVGRPTAEDCYRRTASFVMAPNKTGEDWMFFVFDKHNSKQPYDQRMREVLTATPVDDHVDTLGVLLIETPEQLDQYEQLFIGMGYEGLILRSPNAHYKYGRGTVTKGDLLKLKRYIDFEAEVIDFYEELHNANDATTNALGRTERSSVKANKHGKGTLGGFVVRAVNGPAEGVEFRVGTGFTSEMRRDFWENAPDYKGEICKVKSFPIGVKDKPRHPVFLGFRDMEVDG